MTDKNDPALTDPKALAEKIVLAVLGYPSMEWNQHGKETLTKVESLLAEALEDHFCDGDGHVEPCGCHCHDRVDDAYDRAAEELEIRADFLDKTNRSIIDADYLREIAAVIRGLKGGL